jgi:hypothetical protein
VVDDLERRAQLAGLVWAEELFESVRRSELLTCPQVWPGSLAHARGLATSLSGPRAETREVDRLTSIVQRSAAALWDVLLSWSKLDQRASFDRSQRETDEDPDSAARRS